MTYLFGVLTIPAVCGVAWLLYHAVRLLNHVGERLMARVPLRDARKKAQFAAFAANCRRAYVVSFGGFGAAFLLGYKGTKTKEVHDAVLKVLAPARAIAVRPPAPHDLGVVFDEED